MKARTAFSAGGHSNFDGLSRTDVLRYDTPTFMGFSLSGSLVGDGATEWGAKYAGKFGPVAVACFAEELQRTDRKALKRLLHQLRPAKHAKGK